jgi:hypothetical protein
MDASARRFGAADQVRGRETGQKTQRAGQQHQPGIVRIGQAIEHAEHSSL